MNLRYDRRVPAEMLDALDRTGFAHSLVANARGGRGGLDLQLRGYAGKTPHWASLYLGASKVLDLRYAKGRGFQLEADQYYKVSAHGWNPNWEQWHTEERLVPLWPAVDSYLDRAFLRADRKWVERDGAVFADFSAYVAPDYAVIDRDAGVTFDTASEKQAVRSEMTRPLLAALDPAPKGGAAWWKTAPTLGNECSALAIHTDGSLLVVVVTAGKDQTATTWAPLQATHYANLFSRWIATDRFATDVVLGMLEQRVRLGLAPDLHLEVPDPLTVRPMVVVGGPVTDRTLDRLRVVQERLVERGVGYKDLVVVTTNSAGRPTPMAI